MFNRKWFSHTNIYLLGFLLLIVGLSLSNLIIDFSLIILLINWLSEKKYKEKINTIIKNKLAVGFVLYYFLHVITIFWTNNYEYFLQDLKIKLPILILPLVVSSINLTELHVKIISLSLSALAFIASIIYYFEFIANTLNAESFFIQSLYFGLIICFSIFAIVHYVFFDGNRKSILTIILSILLIRWFLYFLGILQSFTSVIIMVLVSFILFAIYIVSRKHSSITRTFFGIIFSISTLIISFYLYDIGSGFLPFNKKNVQLKEKTKFGNSYLHIKENTEVENGNYIWRNISDKELRRYWNKFGYECYDDKDLLEQPLRTTYIRYLTSKGLTKDKSGTVPLKPHDYRMIYNGCTNYKYCNNSIDKRIYELFWLVDDYLRNGISNDNYVSQKIQLVKIGYTIFKDNFWFGVGTGNTTQEFNSYYKANHLKGYQPIAHNQYFTFAISFGIFGLLYFLYLLFLMLKHTKLNLINLSFWLIFTISMLHEDILGTQEGVTFCMLFVSLLFILQPTKKRITSSF